MSWGGRGFRKVLLTADNLSCPAAAAAFGLRPLPEKIAKGAGGQLISKPGKPCLVFRATS
ncbi:MAG: hypothetical protein D9V47_03540 [Clostridia bacterium]|nr:MAG: hypothetical protein D9V47_03540 [Clostridia bacterium]